MKAFSNIVKFLLFAFAVSIPVEQFVSAQEKEKILKEFKLIELESEEGIEREEIIQGEAELEGFEEIENLNLKAFADQVNKELVSLGIKIRSQFDAEINQGVMKKVTDWWSGAPSRIKIEDVKAVLFLLVRFENQLGRFIIDEKVSETPNILIEITRAFEDEIELWKDLFKYIDFNSSKLYDQNSINYYKEVEGIIERTIEEMQLIKHRVTMYHNLPQSVQAEVAFNESLRNQGISQRELNGKLVSNGHVQIAYDSSWLRGKRVDKDIKDLVQAEVWQKRIASLYGGGGSDGSNKINELKKELASNYKIHLMPQNEQQKDEIVKKFVQKLGENKLLQDSIFAFKFAGDMASYQKGGDERDQIFPVIVIYPATGKPYAQYVLNSIYELFKDMQGSGKLPRFSIKITDLISYAQSDGDLKPFVTKDGMELYQEHAKYYTADGLFFADDFEDGDQNYALEIPLTENPPAAKALEEEVKRLIAQ